MKALIEEFVKNRYGINIKKCCASCAKHTTGSKDELRKCLITGDEHALDHKCAAWDMIQLSDPPKPGEVYFDNAGRGGGHVKKPQYIQYVLDNNGRGDGYEERYGSKYLI